jgi:flagellar assembly protein FliH
MSFVTSGRGKAFVQAVLLNDAAGAAAQEAEVSRRVRSEVSRLRGQAEAEGRAQGEAAARASLQPRADALQTAVIALTSAWAQLSAPLAQKEQEMAGLVTEFAFLLARHIAGVEAASNPAGLENLVTRLLAEAAEARGPRQTLLLRMHPSDLEFLTTTLPPELATLRADETIAQGGAIIEILTEDGDPLDKTEWDATLPSRFATIRAALGLPGSDAA